MRFRFALAAVLFAGWVLARGAEQPASDIVTLNNGNIYSGWLSGGPLVLETGYGRVRLPWSWLRTLRRGDGGAAARITTVHGGRLHGELAAMDLQLDRVLAPVLTVRVADLQAVDFGARQDVPAAPPDVLVLRSGDTLRAAVTASGLQAGEGLGAARLDVLDLAAVYDGLRGQWTRRDGSRGTGPVRLPEVEARLAGGQTLALAPEQVESIGFAVPAVGDPVQALLQRRLPEQRSTGTFRDRLGVAGHGPLMVRVPAGAYRRGDLQGDGDGDEQPVTPVRLAEPFAIGVFEVTFEEYAAFCRATGRRVPDDSGWGGGTRPVVNVSWEDAVAYTEWLSERTGERYRLPSESEWEYAARAGSGTRFWWGQEMDALHANCADCGSPWESERTAPVGRFPANRFGLHDTSGNVWEWMLDCYVPHYEDHPGDGGPLRNDRCGKRVIRGGGWSFPAGEARSASRWRDFPARASDDTGFRVVREVE